MSRMSESHEPSPDQTLPASLTQEGSSFRQPPTWDELNSAQRLQQPDRRDDPTEKELYNAVVQAVLAGVIDTTELANGQRPSPEHIRPHAGGRLAAKVDAKPGLLEELLTQMSDVSLANAFASAAVIAKPPTLPWPGRERCQPDDGEESYTRFITTLATAQEAQDPNSYFSWKDVCSYYAEPLSYTLAPGNAMQLKREGWGRFRVKDLEAYPYPEDKPLNDNERALLAHRFVDLEGIPRLDKFDNLESILAYLPSDTPTLCFVDNARFVAVRGGETVDLGKVKPQELSRKKRLLMNLILLRNLHTSGRAVGYKWLQEKTGYTDLRMAQVDELVNDLGGAIVCAPESRQQQNPHYDIPTNTFIVDARPPGA